jgi:hypothetical protein
MRVFSITTLSIALVLPFSVTAEAIDAGDIALPSGTQLVVKLTNALSSKSSEEGDPWVGKVAEPIFASGQEVVPADSRVRGHVTFVKPPGRATGKGEMRIVAETVSVTGQGNFTIVALLKNADDSTKTKVKDAEGTVQGPGKSDESIAKEAGIGAAVGAGGGALIHGGTGALYGAAIGAVAGVVHSMAKKHQGAVLPPGTELTFVLDRTFLSKRITPPPRSDSSSN